MPPTEPPIRAWRLEKSFRGERRGRDVEALRGVDFEVEAGRIVALVGPNGSGKTTLLRLLAGDLRPDEGEVLVLGEDPAAKSARLRARLSYLAQSLALDPEMSCLETLTLFAALTGDGRRDAARLRDFARAFGLEDHLVKRVSRLSGGLKRRLHVAVSLFGDPEVLLLDEPAASLDAEGERVVWKQLARRRDAGAAVVVATHDLEEAKKWADETVRLDRGRVAPRRTQ